MQLSAASDLGLHCLPMSRLWEARLIWVKVLRRLYLLNLWMEIVHTCPDVRYWSECLCGTIPTQMSVLEVKVTELEKLLKFVDKVFRLRLSDYPVQLKLHFD